MVDILERTSIQALHFVVQRVRICVELDFISKILPLTLLETVPQAENYLAGLLNLAGTSVPVIDLALCLKLPRKDLYTINTPIILCMIEHQYLGIVVDHILGLVNFEKNNMQMNADFKQNQSPFKGVVTLHDELSLLLDPNYLLTMSFAKHLIMNSANMTINKEAMTDE